MVVGRLILKHTIMAFTSPLVVSSRGLVCALVLSFTSCSAQDFCQANGGASFNSACYVFADPSISCAGKCFAEGAPCNEDALELNHVQCDTVLLALGVDIASSTSQWYGNFGPSGGGYSSSRWSFSSFDENRADRGYFHTSGCVVSPAYDATDQTSYTTVPSFRGDAAEAHNFLQEKPTCEGESSLYRRVCSCLFTALPTTPSPTTPAPTTSAPTTAAPTTPQPTPGQTNSLIEAGYWRTVGASADVRPCPIPGLCGGGFGGGDDLCVGSNTGPYCQVCPSSHFSSVNGVCVECGSLRGVTTLQILGVVLAGLLLLGAAAFVGSVRKQDDTHQKGSMAALPRVDAAQQATIDKLWEKMLDLGLLVTSVRRDLLDKSPQRLSVQIQGLLVTIEMLTSKLTRILPRATNPEPGMAAKQVFSKLIEIFTRVPNPEPGMEMKQVFSQADLLCPVIDQLASALAGLSGAMPGEEATILAQIE